MDRNENTLSCDLTEIPYGFYYESCPNVLKTGVKIEFTQEKIEEIIKCEQNIDYFLTHYCHIIDPDFGRCLIKPRAYQTKMINHLNDNRFSILMLPRQSGKSAISALFILYYILFNKDKTIAILANKQLISQEIFSRVTMAYELLPYWLQVGVSVWNRTSAEFGNGCRLFCAATSKSSIRGLTAQLLYIDECAHIDRGLWDEFYTSSYPTIAASQQSKIILVSTPAGLNHFHILWKGATQKKNNFAHFTIKWNEIPGRDEAWLERTKKDIGETRANQEFLCSFLGSSNTLISGDVLGQMEAIEPHLTEQSGHLKIYELPIPGHHYIIGVDTGKGTGRNSSVAQIIDITQEPFKQAAVYKNNRIRPKKYAKTVMELAERYNHAHIMVENNAEGMSVVETLWYDLEYENLVNDKKDVGIRAKKDSKHTGTDVLKEYIEEGRVEITDQDTIYQLGRFCEVSPGIFKGDDGEEDDCVMALLWALYFTKTPEYIHGEEFMKPLQDEDKEVEEEIEEEYPLGLFFGNVDEEKEAFTNELAWG